MNMEDPTFDDLHGKRVIIGSQYCFIEPLPGGSKAPKARSSVQSDDDDLDKDVAIEIDFEKDSDSDVEDLATILAKDSDDQTVSSPEKATAAPSKKKVRRV